MISAFQNCSKFVNRTYIGKTLYPKENLVIHVFSFRYGAIKLKVNNPNNPGIYVNKILVQSYI